MKKIVFISHQADRTGAPIVLLHLLRWLKQNNKFELLIILQGGGELEQEFHEIAETHVWSPPSSTNVWRYRWERVIQHSKRQQQQVARRIKAFAPDAIYGNTIVTAPLGIELKQLVNCPFICHVHELSVVIDEFFGKEKFTELSTHIDFFIAASKAVATNLQESHQVSAELITTVHEFVPELDSVVFEAARHKIRQQLGIADDVFVVAGAGSIDWRKAPDLFIQVAQHIGVLNASQIAFIWIGGKLSSNDGRKVRHDVDKAGVAHCVHFLGAQPNPYDYLNAADLFLLTSREDPYPLVCLEAASLGKPVVCFADSGGMPEFVEQDCGAVIPYLRTDLMAQAVLTISESDGLRRELGANAAKKMRQRHTIELAGQTISKIIGKITG